MGHNTKFIPPRTTNAFYALLTQSGSSNVITQSSGSLVVGVTYKLVSAETGDDFKNVGAYNFANNQYFIATGTTPTNWSNGTTVSHDTGAPVVLSILKDTFTDVQIHGSPFYFLYESQGNYSLKTNYTANFDVNKTIAEITNPTDYQNYSILAHRSDDHTVSIITAIGGSAQDDILGSYLDANCIKVKVYLTY
jgi:hypothetical protein